MVNITNRREDVTEDTIETKRLLRSYCKQQNGETKTDKRLYWIREDKRYTLMNQAHEKTFNTISYWAETNSNQDAGPSLSIHIFI